MYHRLEIPVYIVFFVHILQSSGDLDCDGGGLRLGENPLIYVLLEVAILDELHGDIQVCGVFEPAEEANKMLLVLRPIIQRRAVVWA